MAFDGNKPALTDTKTSVLSTIRDNFARIATLFQGGAGDSNIPTNAKRIDNDGKAYYWNGSAWTALPSNVDDTAYGAGWNGDTDTPPSKNAVYDKIETINAQYPTKVIHQDIHTANTGTGVVMASQTITLPAGKVWKWVKIVLSINAGPGITIEPKVIKQGATDVTSSFVNNFHPFLTSFLPGGTGWIDTISATYIVEGAPTVNNTNLTFSIEGDLSGVATHTVAYIIGECV